MATSIFRENFPAVGALQQAADTAAYIIGLDLHKKTVAICVVDPHTPSTPVFQRKRLPNDELLAVLNRFAGRKVVACESAFGWHALQEALVSMPDVIFVLLDARKTSAWIASSGIKNDAIDAEVLCHVCLHGGIRSLAVYQSGRKARECCKLLRHRAQLVRHRTDIKNQMRAFDRQYGPNPFTGEMAEKSALIQATENDLQETLKESNRRIKALETLMASASAGDGVLPFLRSIPGVGPITAFALRYKIDTIDRFKDAAHLCSYFGFGVREWQSGDTMVKGKITKTGDPLVRKLLIQGAQVVRTMCPEYLPLLFPTMGDPALMKERKHANKVITALARKNLTFVHMVWKKRMAFDIETYRQRKLTASAVSGTIPSSPVYPSSVADLVTNLVH